MDRGRASRRSMALPVRLLLGIELALCLLIAFSPLIVAYALKPDLPAATAIVVLAERVLASLVASIGLIGIALLAWARYGATTPVVVLLFFCPPLVALFLAAWGFR